MLRVIVNEGDKIERALKQFKRKCGNTKLVQELRDRREYHKPSEINRKKMLHARYVQKLRNEEEY
jgi:small subunit ribosomal protein S21